MELVKRYAAAVSRRIWRRDREDIRRELEATLMDDMEQRYGPGGGSDEQVVQMLREYGQPGTVAGQYQEEAGHLVGPRVFPLYAQVLKIVFLAVGIGIGVTHVISLWGEASAHPFLWVLGLFGKLYTAGLAVFGGITLLFFLIERFADPQDIAEEEKDWDPRDLPPLLEESERVRPAGHVAAIVLLGIALVVLHAFGDSLGLIYWDNEGTRQVVGLFQHTRLYAYRPLLSVILAASILHHSLLLATGRMRVSFRVLSLAISGAGLALVLLLWRQRPFFAGETEPLGDLPVLVDALESVVPVVLGVIVLGLLWDIGREIWKLWRDTEGRRAADRNM